VKSKDFEKKLKQTLHQSPAMADSDHLEHTLLLAKNEAYQRHKHERISFTRLLSSQIKFIGWKVWAAQGIFLLIVSNILARAYGRYFWENPHSITKLLFCLSVLIPVTAVPFICRSIRYQMQEVEAATYFSSVKLLMAKLAVIGIGDISLLAGIFITAVIKTSIQTGSAILYLCFPFLFVSSGCLFMLGHFTSRLFFAGSMGLCSFLILICAVIPGHFELLFQQSLSMGWTVICALLIAFCIQQVRYILYDSHYTEMQIT